MHHQHAKDVKTLANTTGSSHTRRNVLAVLLLIATLVSAGWYFTKVNPFESKSNGTKSAPAAKKQPEQQIPAKNLAVLEQKLNTPQLEVQRLATIPDLREDLQELIIPANYTLDLKSTIVEGNLEVADIDGVATLNSNVTPTAGQPKQVTFLFRVIRQSDDNYLVGKAPRK